MAVLQSTVFISYRRKVGWPFAHLVCKDLRQHDYDVFLDTKNLGSGRFDQPIVDEIRNRRHFLVILTHGTLEGCQKPEDWVRREIECAIESKCNIVPIFVDDFNFDENTCAYLTGRLCELRNYNGPRLSNDFFEEGMEHLRTRFLTLPAQENITPPPPQSAPVVQHKSEQAAALPFLFYPNRTGTPAAEVPSLDTIGHVGAIDTRLFSKDKVPRLTSDFQEDTNPENPFKIVFCNSKP
jgi:hypothetical protein